MNIVIIWAFVKLKMAAGGLSPPPARGPAIPYGICDLLANRGSVVGGVSHDTTFATHAIAHRRRREEFSRYSK
jgi:hypothetical protein